MAGVQTHAVVRSRARQLRDDAKRHLIVNSIYCGHLALGFLTAVIDSFTCIYSVAHDENIILLQSCIVFWKTKKSIALSNKRGFTVGKDDSYQSWLISKKDFLEWLVGFVDGDGSFTHNASNDSYSFRITQAGYNAYLLYLIKAQLGFGEVYHDNRGEAHFVVADRLVLIKKVTLSCATAHDS